MKLRFDPSRSDWPEWQQELRQVLHRLLRLPDYDPNPPRAHVLSRKIEYLYYLEEVAYEAEPDVWVQAHLYIPKFFTQPCRAFLSCHGHGPGVDGPKYHYARAMAERGYVVLAPEWRDFGRRALDEPGTNNCATVVALANMLGKTAAGLRLWETMRGLEYLVSRPEVDPSRIVAGGLSLGGELSLLLAALDTRVRAAVVSGFFTDYRSLLLEYPAGRPNCICYAIPNILEYCDMPDLVGLVAPRSLMIQVASRDPWMDLGRIQTAFAKARAIYEALGASDRIALDVIDNLHEFDGTRPYPWFDEVLKAEAPALSQQA